MTITSVRYYRLRYVRNRTVHQILHCIRLDNNYVSFIYTVFPTQKASISVLSFYESVYNLSLTKQWHFDNPSFTKTVA